MSNSPHCAMPSRYGGRPSRSVFPGLNTWPGAARLGPSEPPRSVLGTGRYTFCTVEEVFGKGVRPHCVGSPPYPNQFSMERQYLRLLYGADSPGGLSIPKGRAAPRMLGLVRLPGTVPVGSHRLRVVKPRGGAARCYGPIVKRNGHRNHGNLIPRSSDRLDAAECA